MSIQTTLARIEAEAAAAEWAAHRRHCPGCTGRWQCPQGRQLNEHRARAAQQLAAEREADKLPDERQQPLWA